MDRPVTVRNKRGAVVLLVLVLCISTGCSAISPAYNVGARYYLIDVDACRGLLSPEMSKKGQQSADQRELPQPTDYKIVQCASAVESILRERYNNARLARTGGGVLQVATAAVASLLTGMAGGGAVGVATVLSGTSAIMPELSNIVEAKDRAEAYNDGVRAIGSAAAVYFKAIAAGEGKVSTERLTPPGAALRESLVTAIHLVEQRLAAQLPTVEDLQKARGEFARMEVIPTTVTLDPNQTTTVQVSYGGPATGAASDNDKIASVKLINTHTAEITAVAQVGKATITFSNSRGGAAVVTVRVPIIPLNVSREAMELAEGTERTIEVSGPPAATAKSAKADVAEVSRVEDGKKVTIKARKAGETTIRLYDRSERSDTVKVTVTPKTP